MNYETRSWGGSRVDVIEVKANWIPAEKVDSAKYYVKLQTDFLFSLSLHAIP